MPNIASSPQITTPSSTKGSAPVSEVLGRIQVRDPRHAASGIYGRRLSDYESRAPRLQAMALFMAAAFIMGSFWSVFLQHTINIWNTRPMNYTRTPIRPSMQEEPLILPQGIHPQPRTAPRRPLAQTPAVVARPENLHARFQGPRVAEFRWDSLGDGYVYRLYAAATPDLKNAQPASEQATPSSYTAWTPEDGIQNVWVAVKAIDGQGKETAFSRPLFVQFPM